MAGATGIGVEFTAAAGSGQCPSGRATSAGSKGADLEAGLADFPIVRLGILRAQDPSAQAFISYISSKVRPRGAARLAANCNSKAVRPRAAAVARGLPAFVQGWR